MIVLWNIQAGAFEYLCVTVSSRNVSLLSALTVTYCAVCAPPIAQTSSDYKVLFYPMLYRLARILVSLS